MIGFGLKVLKLASVECGRSIQVSLWDVSSHAMCNQASAVAHHQAQFNIHRSGT